jgi:hypothetical protein
MSLKVAAQTKPDWSALAILVKAAQKPDIVELPERMALAVDGSGPPSSDAFSRSLAALYGIAYGVKFARKASGQGTPFKVAPLEGQWSAAGWTDPKAMPPPERWTWRLRIAIPPDVSPEEVKRIAAMVVARKGGKLEGSHEARQVFLETIPAVRCGRILHVGPYADEPRSFAAMQELLDREGVRARHGHIEIYLSDPRRTVPGKLKTVLFKAIA